MPIAQNLIRVAQIIIYGDIAAAGGGVKNTVTVFNYRRLAVAITPSKVDLDTQFQATVVAPLLLALNNRWTQRKNSIRFVNDADDAPFEVSHVNVGAVAGDSMTGNECAMLRYRTALKGKSNRGKSFLGPLSEADSTAGTSDILNAAAIARFGAVVTGLGTDLVCADTNVWRLVILSRVKSQMLTNTTNLYFNDVTQIALNTRITDLRSRKTGSVY